MSMTHIRNVNGKSVCTSKLNQMQRNETKTSKNNGISKFDQIQIESIRDGSSVVCTVFAEIELNHQFEAFHLELNRIVTISNVELFNLIRFYLSDVIKLNLCGRTCLR